MYIFLYVLCFFPKIVTRFQQSIYRYLYTIYMQVIKRNDLVGAQPIEIGSLYRIISLVASIINEIHSSQEVGEVGEVCEDWIAPELWPKSFSNTIQWEI